MGSAAPPLAPPSSASLRARRVYLGLVAFSLAGSALSAATRLNPGPIAPAAAALTVLAGAAAVLTPFGARAIRAGLALVGIGALSELAGVTTGLPFGLYAYTAKWWPTVVLPNGANYPLLVPFAWALMAGGGWLAVARLPHAAARVLAGATLATVIDGVVMEPVMAGPLDYWRWLEAGPLPGGASILNPVGWFLTSALGGLLLERMGPFPNREHLARQGAIVLFAHVVLTLGVAALVR